ncbi:MAG: cyclic nucleotide-binding domain-containing protein [Chloroflexota bacterium]
MKESFIQNAPLFSSLSPDEQKLIGHAMKELSFAKGETLCAQGQPSLKLYLIQSGWVRQTTALDGGRTLVNNLGAGSLVCEMDVLLAQPAASTATTNSDVTVWSLAQADLNPILNEYPRIGLKLSAALGSRVKQVEHYLVHKRLRTTRLFSDLDDEQLTAIAEQLEPLEVRRGGLVFRAGAPGDALFIVEEGEVILTSNGEESGEPFRQLAAGDVMGEMAVLTGKPYDGLARASSEAVLWVLHRDNFLTLTTRYPNIRVAMSSRVSQPLSADDRVLAQKQLAHLALFADLPYDASHAVASVLVLRHYPAGERIFAAGDPGDSLIIVDSGEVTLSAADGKSRCLKSGDRHGEQCLLTGKSRTETATAATDSNLWILYKSDFDELLARFPALGTALSTAVTAHLDSTNHLFLNQHLRSIALFANLNAEELRDIAQALHPLRLGRGEVIFSEGQRGDAVYFIETGEVQIATRAGASYQMSFARLLAGDFFGELALLADNPRKSTARAVVNDTQLWVLHKTDFDQIVLKHPQLALSMSKALGERLARTDTRTAAPHPHQVKPPSAGLPATGARPLVAKPSSVPIIKRPMAPAPRPTVGTRAAPLTVKPPIAARPMSAAPQARPVAVRPTPIAPQARPVAKRPLQPLVPPRAIAPRPMGVPQSRAVAPRPVVRPPAVIQQPYADPVTLAVMDSVKWMISRPVGFKFRFAALTMLFVWLCGITAPVAAITAAKTLQPGGTQLEFGGVSVNIGTDNGAPLPIQVAIIPTFTPTPPPTQKPVKVNTVQSAPTKVVAVVVPINTPAPTARPVVRPTVVATVAGPVAASVPNPAASSVDYVVEKVRRLTGCENQGNHNLYIVVLDKDGNGVPNHELEIVWDSGSAKVRTGNKVENIPWLGVDSKTTKGYVDFAMFKGRYRVRLTSATSEQSKWVSPDIVEPERCDKNDNPVGNSLFHNSFLVVFRKTR